MKKIIILSVSILLVLTVAALALLFFAPTPLNPHSIERTAGFRAKEIVHVRINSGWKSAETEKAEEIQEIANWVSEIRIELKKKLVRKQEMEQRNHAIYSYMHDVFGAEVIDIFDLQYNPEEQQS